MAKNGVVQLTGLVVQSVLYAKGNNTESRVVAKGGPGNQYTVTIEKAGGFPDDMKLREDFTVDIRLDFDK